MSTLYVKRTMPSIMETIHEKHTEDDNSSSSANSSVNTYPPIMHSPTFDLGDDGDAEMEYIADQMLTTPAPMPSAYEMRPVSDIFKKPAHHPNYFSEQEMKGAPHIPPLDANSWEMDENLEQQYQDGMVLLPRHSQWKEHHFEFFDIQPLDLPSLASYEDDDDDEDDQENYAESRDDDMKPPAVVKLQPKQGPAENNAKQPPVMPVRHLPLSKAARANSFGALAA